MKYIYIYVTMFCIKAAYISPAAPVQYKKISRTYLVTN